MTPLVTVIVPMRNEEHHIGPCLDALLNQSYPLDRLEVLVVDGRSTDRSRVIAAKYQDRFPDVLILLDNERRTAPAALNLALGLAHGEVVIRVDAHVVVATDFIERTVATLEKSGAECAGGRVIHRGHNWITCSMAAVLSSPFGVGNAKFRYAISAQYVDTVAFGGYRRDIFDRVGCFDERLTRNQDIEFNWRLRASGGRILFDPRIRSYYSVRPSLGGFVRQAYLNGYWNIITLRLHPRALSWRHFTPLIFLLVTLGGLVVGLLARPVWVLLEGVWGLYAVLAAVSSVLASARGGWDLLPPMMLLFPALHLSYGFGSLVAVVRGLFSRC